MTIIKVNQSNICVIFVKYFLAFNINCYLLRNTNKNIHIYNIWNLVIRWFESHLENTEAIKYF